MLGVAVERAREAFILKFGSLGVCVCVCVCVCVAGGEFKKRSQRVVGFEEVVNNVRLGSHSS